MLHFDLLLTALVVNIWPYAFTPTGVALAALVTHIYLSIRQVYWYTRRSQTNLCAVGSGD